MDLSALGISQADVRHIQAAPSFEEGARRLEDLKARARKTLRKLAADLHPDRTDDDPEKTDQLKELTALMARFTAVKLVTAPPVVKVYVVQQGMYGSGTSSSTTYTNCTWRSG